MLVGFGLFVRHERGSPGQRVRGPRRVDRRDRPPMSRRSAAACSTSAPGCAATHPEHRHHDRADHRRLVCRHHRHEPGAALAPEPGPDRPDRSPNRSWSSTAASTSASTTAAPGVRRTARPRCTVPLGRVIGEVSVGIRESSVSSALWHESPPTQRGSVSRSASAPWPRGPWPGDSSAALSASSWTRSPCCCRSAKRRCTASARGSSPSTPSGRVSMVNDEAQRLLGLDVTAAGRTPA